MSLYVERGLGRCHQVKLRSRWIRMGLKSNDWCPHEKREIWTERHTEREYRHVNEDRGRNQSEAATRQGVPRISGNQQKVEEAGMINSWRLQKKDGSEDVLFSNFYPLEL
jgi:hypothetical protein